MKTHDRPWNLQYEMKTYKNLQVGQKSARGHETYKKLFKQAAQERQNLEIIPELKSTHVLSFSRNSTD